VIHGLFTAIVPVESETLSVPIHYRRTGIVHFRKQDFSANHRIRKVHKLVSGLKRQGFEVQVGKPEQRALSYAMGTHVDDDGNKKMEYERRIVLSVLIEAVPKGSCILLKCEICHAVLELRFPEMLPSRSREIRKRFDRAHNYCREKGKRREPRPFNLLPQNE
jgi:hypothetical protein